MTFRVRIIDLSDDSGDNVVEEVGPFDTLDVANLFAQRYVRDSVERCRAQGMDARAVLDAWQAYGEDAIVPDTEEGWQSAPELEAFAAARAAPEDRDWRSLDPRLHGPAEDDDDDDVDEDEEDDDLDEDPLGPIQPPATKREGSA